MAKKQQSEFWEKYRDPRWQKKRLEVLEAYGWKCFQCESSDHTLNVHHRIYRKNANPWDYSHDDLVALCEDCHENEHGVRNDLKEAVRLLGQSELSEVVGYAKAVHNGVSPGIIKFSNADEVAGAAKYFRVRHDEFDALVDRNGCVNVDEVVELIER